MHNVQIYQTDIEKQSKKNFLSNEVFMQNYRRMEKKYY